MQRSQHRIKIDHKRSHNSIRHNHSRTLAKQHLKSKVKRQLQAINELIDSNKVQA